MTDVNENERILPINSSFIGGAERARRNARKRKFLPRSNSNSDDALARHSLLPYPKSMREYERFFGSLLSSSAFDVQQSENDGNTYRAVIQQACALMNVPCLPTPPHLQHQTDARTHHFMQRSSSTDMNTINMTASPRSGTFDNARSYYMSLAPLILEESRCILADALNSISSIARRADTFILELTSFEEKYAKLASTHHGKYAPLILHLQIIGNKKKSGFGGDSNSAKWTRPGSVVLLRRKDTDGNDFTTSIIACINPMGCQQSISSSSPSSTVSLIIFRRGDLEISQYSDEKNLLFYATPMTTLISQVRQMEACMRMVKVSFMRKLLGQKNPTHIRFDNNSDDDDDDDDEEERVVGDVDEYGAGDGGVFQEGYYVGNDDAERSIQVDEREDDDKGNTICDVKKLSGLLDNIPALNSAQERAAKLYLHSPPESLILVQGPPGTGKSTFLVNVICRRLASNPQSRILVSAPTNKAVTVIAERFLDVVTSSDLSCSCNAVLIGVEDKLITPSSSCMEKFLPASDALSSSLRSIFVYTWVESLKMECLSILASIKSICNVRIEVSRSRTDLLVARVEKVERKIFMSIPSSKSVRHFAKLLRRQIGEVAAIVSWNSSLQENDIPCILSVTPMLEKAINLTEQLVDALDKTDSPVPELLATARVIFCTLSSAGSSLLKHTRGVDDLLIDEAAAATEAEICIPFHLRPLRMLAVGDPRQLPPTILSRFAANMGLSTSLHERLMNKCNADYIMLDCQYRMHKQISLFPCNQFYNAKVTDGKNVLSKTRGSDVALPTMKPFSFINIRGNEFMQSGGSYANEEECMSVLKVVQKIAARNVPGWDSCDKLRIITFYNGQVSLLRQLLSKRGYGKVMVATVDASQGCEADVVIISFVRSSSKKGVRHAAGFLSDDRRINVALTRARHQLICIGDAHGTLGQQGSLALKNLVAHAKRRGSLI